MEGDDEDQQATHPQDGHPRKRKPKTKPVNPLQAGICSFLTTQQQQPNLNTLPKRFTLYERLLLLPANFPTHDPDWTAIYDLLSQSDKQLLFSHIARAFKDVTHIALNAPIAPTTASQTDNIVRSPSNLQPLFGDFGPGTIANETHSPFSEDFDAAFWVSSTQHGRDGRSVKQIWAPRWTMFSRGNVREKARILGDGVFAGLASNELGGDVDGIEVVDFYVGIGYFTLCYLARGVKRVWGWDLNPWSIEGLRRGCEANGWACLIVRLDEEGMLDGSRASEVVKKILRSEMDGKPLRCIAFLGDNRKAGEILSEIAQEAKMVGWNMASGIRHANLGLLPTSRGSWSGAVQSLDRERGGWIHVHENVDILRMDEKREDILHEIRLLVQKYHGTGWVANCDHTEQVKTYAPGVMHSVFDIAIGPRIS